MRFATATLTLSCLCLAVLATSASAELTDVRINEIFASMTGSDNTEFVEFHGPAETDLTGLTLVIIEGDAGSEGLILNAQALAGAIPAGGLFVLGDAGTPNPASPPPNQTLTGFIQDGSQTYLLVTGFTGAVGQDADADNDGTIDPAYTALGTIVDMVGTVDSGATDRIYAGAPVIGPEAGGFAPPGVARKSDSLDTNTAADWCITSFYLIPPATGIGSDGYDAARPGVSNSYSCVSGDNTPPVASDGDATVAVDDAAGVFITLVATDDDLDPLDYTVLTLPAAGSMVDPYNSNASVTAGMTLAGNQVRYYPASVGSYSFTFKANDGTDDSNTATVDITVTAAGGTPVLVITEIMYDPANTEPAYEYVEIYNAGTGPANLTGYFFDDEAAGVLLSGNIQSGTIPAGGTGVLIGPGRLNDMKAAWGLTINFIEVTTWPPLNNSNEQVGIWPDLVSYDNHNFANALDAVAYTTSGPWPTSVTPSSIYLKSAFLNATDNNTGGNWAKSQVGIDGAYQAAVGTDVGSPGYVPVPAGSPPVVTAVKSRKTHGGAGTFDIDTETTTGTECRNAGPTTVVVTFDQNIQQVANTNADVTLSSGTVGGLAVSGADLTITLSGATDAAKLTIGFPGIAAATSISAVSTDTACIAVLKSDIDGNRSVTIFDLLGVRQVLNQAVAAGNFRRDVDANGNTISIFDLLAVRQSLNKTVPACP